MHESLITHMVLGGFVGFISGIVGGLIYGALRLGFNERRRANLRRIIDQIGWKGALKRALFETQEEPELPFPKHAH